MSSKKLKLELLVSFTLSKSPYSTKYNSNRKLTMRGFLPRKAVLSYCILGILSAFSHSAIAHGPGKITPIENDEQFLTGVLDPNTRNTNKEGIRGIFNSNPSGTADVGLIGQRKNSPAPATAAITKNPFSVSEAKSNNEKPQDKRHSKKKKKLKQATLNHAKRRIGHAEDNTKTATDASVKQKNNIQDLAQSVSQRLDQEQAVMNAHHTAHSVTANAGNLALAAAGSPSSMAVKQHHGAALSRGQNIKKASNSEDMFTYDPQTDVMHVDANTVGTTISIAGRQGDRVITGLVNGVRNNDAANVGQLNRVNNAATSAQALAQKNTSRIKDIENNISNTNTKIDRGLAASAALTGLFQPYGVGKINFTAGMGGYGSSQAIAVGSGYRISENTAFKGGVAYSGGSNVMYNASFNLEW